MATEGSGDFIPTMPSRKKEAVPEGESSDEK